MGDIGEFKNSVYNDMEEQPLSNNIGRKLQYHSQPESQPILEKRQRKLQIRGKRDPIYLKNSITNQIKSSPIDQLIKYISSLYNYVLESQQNTSIFLSLLNKILSQKILIRGEALIDILNCLMILQHKSSPQGFKYIGESISPEPYRANQMVFRGYITKLLLNVVKLQNIEIRKISQKTQKKVEKKQKSVNKHVNMLVNSLVDNTVLYMSRRQKILELYPQEVHSELIERLPLKITPANIQQVDINVHRILAPLNGVIQGVYGWCVVCREQQAVYNQEIGKQLCGKMKCLSEYILALDNWKQQKKVMNKSSSLLEAAEEVYKHDWRKDMRKLMTYLIKLGFKPLKKLKNQNSKKQTLLYILSLLESILQQLDTTRFQKDQKFTKMLKFYLFPNLISLIPLQQPFLSPVLKIQLILTQKFPKKLKNEIYLLNYELLGLMLQSPLSQISSKKVILEYLGELLQTSEILKNFWVNFDQCYVYGNLLEKVVFVLLKFIQKSYVLEIVAKNEISSCEVLVGYGIESLGIFVDQLVAARIGVGESILQDAQSVGNSELQQFHIILK